LRLPLILPVEFLYTQQELTRVATPDDIGAGGCYFSADPELVQDNHVPVRVRVHLPKGKPIECAILLIEEQMVLPPHSGARPSIGGKKIIWKLDDPEATRRFTRLYEADRRASYAHKVALISAEQTAIANYVGDIERQRWTRTSHLITIVVAYMAFVASPYASDAVTFSAQLAASYAIGGGLLAYFLIIFGCHHLGFLATTMRQRGFLFTAMNANRSYVFSNDPHYYETTVFPLDDKFDDNRAYSYLPGPPGIASGEFDRVRAHLKKLRMRTASPGSEALRREFTVERSFGRVLSSSRPILLFLGIQAFLLLTIFQFASILFRLRVDGIVGFDVNGASPDMQTASWPALFDLESIRRTFLKTPVLLVAWLQVVANKLRSYFTVVAELERISLTRPNPRLTLAAWRHSETARRLTMLLQLLGVSAVALTAAAWLPARFRSLVSQLPAGLLDWTSVGTMALFAAVKAWTVHASLRREHEADAFASALADTRAREELLK